MMQMITRAFSNKQVRYLLPPWSQRMYRDPFDYPLRSLEEVKAELEKNPIPNEAQVEIVHYKDTAHDRSYDIRDSVVKMYVDMDTWNLTKLQKERLLFLLGPRYKGVPRFKIVGREYATREQNIQKCMDVIYELLMETKRAP